MTALLATVLLFPKWRPVWRGLSCFIVGLMVIANSSPGTVNAADPPEILEVRAVYKDCVAAKKQPQKSKTKFYLDFNPGAKPKWSLAEDRNKTLSEISIFVSDGLLRSATLLERSPDGHWKKTHDYCFRRDGSIAFILAVLETDRGEARVEDRFYYDSASGLTRQLRKMTELNSRKPLPKERQNWFEDRPAKIFLNAQKIFEEVGRILDPAEAGLAPVKTPTAGSPNRALKRDEPRKCSMGGDPKSNIATCGSAILETNMDDFERLARLYTIRGRAYLRLKRYGKALSDFEDLIFIDPDSPEHYLNRADSLAALQDYEGAKRDYRKVLDLSADGELRSQAEAKLKKIGSP